MKVLILAAGYGTRLQAIAKDTPKALLDINGRPLINYVLDKIKTLPSLNGVILVTNKKFYLTFQEWAKTVSSPQMSVDIVNDGTQTPEDRLGSIGDIDFALKQRVVKDDLLVLGSDNLFDYSLHEYVETASRRENDVTIGLYDIQSKEESKKFGVVSLDSHSKITSFEEKPSEPKSTLVSMCCYYLPQNTLGLVGEYLQEVKKSDTAGDYIRWLHQKGKAFGFKFDGKWYDIGSIESYQEAQQKFKQ